MKTLRYRWKHATKIIAAFAFVHGLLSPCSAGRVAEQSLLSRASKVIDCTKVKDRDQGGEPHDYYWMSPSKMLEIYWSPGSGLVSRENDIRKHRFTAPVTLIATPDPSSLDVGPQARWLIWTLVHSGGTFTTAEKTNGRGGLQLNYGEVPSYVWNEDGHRLLEFYDKPRGRTLAILRDLDRPTHSTRIWSTTNIQLDRDPFYPESPQATFTADGRLLQYRTVTAPDKSGRKRLRARVIVSHVGRQITPLHQYTFDFLPNQPRHLIFSPNGRRVLWALPRPDVGKWKKRTESLWISDLNGQHRREIGRLYTEYLNPNWLPDNKHIFFWYQKVLYTVSI